MSDKNMRTCLKFSNFAPLKLIMTYTLISGDALFCPTIEVPRPEYLKADDVFVGNPVYSDGHVCCLFAGLSKDQDGKDVLAVALKLAALRSHWNVEAALCILWIVTDDGRTGVTSTDINIRNDYDIRHNCFIVNFSYFRLEVSDHSTCDVNT